MALLQRRVTNVCVDRELMFLRGARLRHILFNGQEIIASSGSLLRMTTVSQRNVSATASLTLDERIHENRTIVLNSTSALTVTVPLATGSGAIYRFIVGTVNTNSYFFKPPTGTTLFKGTILQTNSASAGALRGWSPGATDDTITLNGTTTGGAAVGDYIEIQDIAANTYAVRGSVTSSGAATPYSDTVA
jgi:hypothetical protein